MNDVKVSIIVPTYNGGSIWNISAGIISEIIPDRCKVFVIDSSSKDDTVNVAKKNNFFVEVISASEFNHGGTRNKGVKMSDSDVVIFFTQDAIPEVNCINNILKAFSDPKIACAYGRQLPHVDANPLAVHARTFNYKQQSYISDVSQKDTLGLKTIFMSNSFSAYRVSIFNELGGFPESTILGEDMYFAGKSVLAGYKLAYVADAKVRHSHNYSAIEEFKRYFDIGVFHRDEKWIYESFGGAGGEGKKFIFSELNFLIKNHPLWIPAACISNFAKIVGYKLGKNYKKLPSRWRRKLSMHKRYWDSVSD